MDLSIAVTSKCKIQIAESKGTLKFADVYLFPHYC